MSSPRKDFDWSALERDLKKSFIKAKENWVQLKLLPQELLSVCQVLSEQWGFFFLLDLWASDHKDQDLGHRFQVHYDLLNLENSIKVEIIVELDRGDRIDSVLSIWPSASWYQLEVTEMFGIQFIALKSEQAPSRKLFFHGESTPHPLLKDVSPRVSHGSQQKQTKLSWSSDSGIINPYGLGLARYFYQEEQGTITRAELQFGFSYKGIEFISENKNYDQLIPLLGKMSPTSGVFYSFALVDLMESALRVPISERVMAIRMIALELSRILEHLSCVKAMAIDAEYSRLIDFTSTMTEMVLDYQKAVFDQRYLDRSFVVGGLRNDLSRGWSGQLHYLLDGLISQLDEVDKMICRSRTWMSRTSLYPVHAKLALDWGMTGPNLRATGVNYDLRKVSPFYFYKDVDFDIPLGINGDAYDRCLVRVEEMRQSMKIILQLIDNLPHGQVKRYEGGSARRDQSNLAFIEGLASMLPKQALPLGNYSKEFESGNGVQSMKVISLGNERPYRLRLRTSSFAHAQFLENHGYDLSPVEFQSLFASLNICSAEVDR